MPLSLMTLSVVASPVTLQEGLKILERDDHRCQYCGLDGRASFENALVMRVDFVVPRARKGKKDPGNLVACCTPCNTIKGTRVYANFDEAGPSCSNNAKSCARIGNPRRRGLWPRRQRRKATAIRPAAGCPRAHAGTSLCACACRVT